jgi:hypothetical protein
MNVVNMWQTTLDKAVDFDAITDVDSFQGFEPLQYYLSLPTSEYQNSPNFKAFLQLLLTPFNDCSTLINNMYTYFNIDTVIGEQLDIIGQLVGQGRTINFNPSNGSSPTLPDVDYQTLLKAKIIQNMWDGTIPSLYTAWSILFPSGVIVVKDNQDMTMDVIIAGNFTSTIQDLITHDYIVPRPAGVLINYAFGTLPIFGYDTESAFINGYDIGYWLVTT